jgi:hypothetical protein
MKSPQNTVIIVLTVTAAILGGMFVGAWQDNKAQAAYTSVSKGDYIMFAYQWSDQFDLLCVIDVAAHKMKTYSVNKTTKALDVAPDVDLDRVFAAD